jgi:HPt (histidine-containing phosphotransfer) domain-containing protein
MKNQMECSKPVLVRVKSEISDLVPMFLKTRVRDVTRLRECMLKYDFYTAYVIGHNLTGTAASYGFPGLTEIGRRLEMAAQLKNEAGVRESALNIENYVKDVEVVYVR